MFGLAAANVQRGEQSGESSSSRKSPLSNQELHKQSRNTRVS
jgi:hypothetical protein